jgi:protein tyrosine/serine phosphatase
MTQIATTQNLSSFASPKVQPAGYEPNTKIGEEHKTLDRFKRNGALAGGLTGVAIVLPGGFVRGASQAVSSAEGRDGIKKAALIGGCVLAGTGLALGAVFGGALLGPIGAVLQGVKGAAAGLAVGAAAGALGKIAFDGASLAVRSVPTGWARGRDLGEAAAVGGMQFGAETMIWLGEQSKLLHAIGMKLNLLMQSEPKGADHQRVKPLDTDIWRSAQPGPEVWSDLKARGFKSVVNLRMETNYEKEAVKAAGLQAYYLPESPLKAPTVQQALEFLDFVTDKKNQPVLFHCFSGVDRTGTMAACYRIAVQGWTQEQALAECFENGMMRELQGDKIRFILEFNQAWQEMQVKGTAPTFP